MIVPTLVLAVLTCDPEPEPAGVLEVPDDELPHAARPITAAARTGAAHHRLRIVFLHSLRAVAQQLRIPQ
jgi:hypothetical protein